MKKVYIFLLSLSVLFLLYFIFFKALKRKEAIALKIRGLIYAALYILVANIFIALSINETISFLAYTFYFISLDFTLFFLVAFSHEYTMNMHANSGFKYFMLALVFADTLSFLVNIFTHHSFYLTLYIVNKNSVYYIVPSFIYHFHLILDYALIANSFFYLIRAAVIAPKVYKIKYVSIFSSVTLVMIWNAIYMLNKGTYDISILLYPLIALSIYYIALIFVPQQLTMMTMNAVADDLKDALILIDMYGKCVYINNSAKRMFKNELNDKNKGEDALVALLGKGENLFSKSNDSEQIDYKVGDEIHHYRAFFNRLEDSKNRFTGSYFIIEDETETLQKLAAEHYRATHDTLTGLYNREYFYERVTEKLQKHKNTEYLMICSNIMNFKLVNDQYGTERGDNILKKIADELRCSATNESVYGRLTSDHFALFMPKKKFSEDLFLNGPLQVFDIMKDVNYNLICQIGVYTIEERNVLVSAMCDKAFIALSTIKNNPGKQIAYYDDKIRNKIIQEQEIINTIPSAIRNNEVQIYLQPQVDSTGKILGAEALVRWYSKDKGLIPAKDFISILENNGMISIIDQYVWNLACKQLQKWKSKGREDLYISVNISPKDLYLLDVYKVLTELVERYCISPQNLKLEITEIAVMLDKDRQAKIIEKLQSYGFTVEMDDFGTGYSSFNTLKDFCMDVLKIDMSFFHKSKDTIKMQKILKNMISLSKSIGMTVITEGVETAEQAEFLHTLGSDVFQGYYFSQPMPIMEFDEKYTKSNVGS